MKLNSKAFSTIEALLIVVIASILGGTGYYVYNANKNTNNTYKAASKDASGTPKYAKKAPSSKGLATINKAKLPTGWHVDTTDAATVVVSNQGEGEPAANCFVEAYKNTDSKATAGSTEFATQEQAATENGTHDQKGYTYEHQAASSVKVVTKDGTKTLDAFYSKVLGSDGSLFSYEKDAYIVLDGAFVTVTQSCSTQDFSQADQALTAITLQV
jgi:hypothetical protein